MLAYVTCITLNCLCVNLVVVVFRFCVALQEIDVLTLGAKDQDQLIADRNKRTIGLLRELFPDITKVRIIIENSQRNTQRNPPKAPSDRHINQVRPISTYIFASVAT